MKVLATLALVLVAFQIGCSASTQRSDKTAATAQIDGPKMVGGDRDAHNCIPSAGYQWSVTRNSCIRIWEVGTRLASTINSQVTPIVIENGIDGPMELRLGDGSDTLVLPKTGMEGGYGVWRDAVSRFNITRADLGILELRDHEGKLIATSKAPEF